MPVRQLGPSYTTGPQLTEENRAAHLAALLREQEHYKRLLSGAESTKNEDKAEEMRQRIKQVSDSLRAFGHVAAAPAKRAEQRPAAKAETR